MRAVVVVLLVACGSGSKQPPPEDVATTFKQLEPKVKAIGALGPKFDAAKQGALPTDAVPGLDLSDHGNAILVVRADLDSPPPVAKPKEQWEQLADGVDVIEASRPDPKDFRPLGQAYDPYDLGRRRFGLGGRTKSETPH